MSTSTPLPKTQPTLLLDTTTATLSLSPAYPVPTPSPTEHLIHIAASAICNGELTWGPFVAWPEQHVPVFDICGTILTEVQGSPFRTGDSIFGRIAAGREGAGREYATILPSETALKPKTLGAVEAATVPMSALTAWQALFEHGELAKPSAEGGRAVENEGKRVLVLAASGGVGMWATQLAKLAGAEVVGTCSSRNAEFVLGMGADAVVDYTATSVEAWVEGDEKRKFDVVFDCAGGRSREDGWRVVRKGGRFVSIVPGYKEPEGGVADGVRGLFFILESRGEQLAVISRLIEKGLLKTVVDSVWSLEEYKEAFAKVASGHTRGKVVFKIGG